MEVKVRVSDLRKFLYCPTQFFFDTHYAIKPRWVVRLRMLLGTIAHLFRRLLRIKWISEELISADLTVLGIKLVGKPDYFKVSPDGGIIIEEFKSRRSPRGRSTLTYGDVWLSDALQVMGYALLLFEGNLSKVAGVKSGPTSLRLVVRYLDRAVTVKYDEELLFAYLMRLLRVIEGVFPEPRYVSERKCMKCQYREFCPFSPLNTKVLE